MHCFTAFGGAVCFGGVGVPVEALYSKVRLLKLNCKVIILLELQSSWFSFHRMELPHQGAFSL